MVHSPLSSVLSLPVRTVEPFEDPVDQVPSSRKPVYRSQELEPYMMKTAYILCSESSRMRELLLRYSTGFLTQRLNVPEAMSWYMTMINSVLPMQHYDLLGSEIGYHFFRVLIKSLDDIMEMVTDHPDIFHEHVRRFPIEQSDLVCTAAVGVLCMFIGRNLTQETYVDWSRKFMNRFMVLLNLRMNSSDVQWLPSIESAMHLNAMFQQSCTMRRYVLVAIDAASAISQPNVFSITKEWLKMAALTKFHMIFKYLCSNEVHPILRLPGWEVERSAVNSSISKWRSIPTAYRPYAQIIYAKEDTCVFSSSALQRPSYAALMVARARNPKLCRFVIERPLDAENIEQYVSRIETNRHGEEKSG